MFHTKKTIKGLNLISDYIPIDDKIYLFVGNYKYDMYLMLYEEIDNKLKLFASKKYNDTGIPLHIVDVSQNKITKYFVSGYYPKQIKYGNGKCTYDCYIAWTGEITYLDPILDKMYKELNNVDSNVRYLPKGDKDRLKIAESIADYNGNGELMYIRYMKTDHNYAFVITG